MTDLFICYARDREIDHAPRCSHGRWRRTAGGAGWGRKIVLRSSRSVEPARVRNESAAVAGRGVRVPAMIEVVKLSLGCRRRRTADLVGGAAAPAGAPPPRA